MKDHVRSVSEVPAAALRRLSVAVNEGGHAWVVMSFTGPLFHVAGGAPTQREAEALFHRLGLQPDEYVIVGPVAGAVPVEETAIGGFMCHVPSTSEACETRSRPPAGGWPLPSRIARIVVTVELHEGESIVQEFGPSIDAIFLTRRARELFAYPYYRALYGAGYVAGLRERWGDT